MTGLEGDDESGALSAEVEEAAGSYNPFDPGEFDPSEYAPKLDKAIDALPERLQTIVQMLRKGIPIDSKDPHAVTIAGTLKKSEKTIRTYRDKAFKKLKAALTAGE